jgi:hypothetical protein
MYTVVSFKIKFNRNHFSIHTYLPKYKKTILLRVVWYNNFKKRLYQEH